MKSNQNLNAELSKNLKLPSILVSCLSSILFFQNNSYTDVCLPKCNSEEDCNNEKQSCYNDGRCLYACTWRQRDNCPEKTICDRYENACLKPCKNDNQCKGVLNDLCDVNEKYYLCSKNSTLKTDSSIESCFFRKVS